MVASVRGAGHDGAAGGGNRIIAYRARRRRRRRGRRCRRGCRCRTGPGKPEGHVAEVPLAGVSDECDRAIYGVDGVNLVTGPRRREQNAVGAHTETIIKLVHRHGGDAVGINRRDGVQRWAILKGIERRLIKRAVGSKTETSACARTGVAYERRNGRADVDGVQKASNTHRAYAVEHAGARLEAKIADTDRRSVVGNRANRGNQGAGIRIDLDERAATARPCYGRGKEAAIGMEGNPGQAHPSNRRADHCAAAICLINGYQRAAIQCTITITAIHGLDTRGRR